MSDIIRRFLIIRTGELQYLEKLFHTYTIEETISSNEYKHSCGLFVFFFIFFEITVICVQFHGIDVILKLGRFLCNVHSI